VSETLDYEIGPPTMADAEAIARVHVGGWADAYRELLPRHFYDDSALHQRERMWRDILAAPELPPRLRVARVDETIVGFAFAGASRGASAPRDLELYMIYIAALAYGTGIGQRLLDSVLDTEPAQLWVAEGNPRGIAFYRRNGFRPDGVRKIDSDTNDLAEIRMLR
jgi:ribosomal protein S18 acetylase RimI-like enzyme